MSKTYRRLYRTGRKTLRDGKARGWNWSEPSWWCKYGTVGLVCPRSGLAVKKGITVLNSPGVVDAGYRGDVGVILFNSGEDPFVIQRGDRIAQLLVLPVLHPSFEFVESLDDTERGEGGFGSTGV